MYQLKSINKKGDYTLLKNEMAIGSLIYKKRLSINAIVNLENNLFEIKAKTFWRRKINIYNNTKNIGSLTFNWKSQAIINLIDAKKESISFKLKKKKLGKRVGIYSAGSSLLFTMKRSKFNWKTFNYNYNIKQELEIKYYNTEELLMYTAYMLNLYKRNGQ